MNSSTALPASRLSRRAFVKAGAVASAALLTGAPYVRGEDKAGAKAPVVGAGEHRYEVLHDWLMPPSDIAYGNTHGVVQDAQGRFYIAHTVHKSSQKGDAIVVFDADGKFITSWGPEYRGSAHGLHIAKEGGEEFLYHCLTGQRKVVKTTLKGKVLWERGCPEETGGYKKPDEYIPTNVATAPNGTVFVADGYGRNYIHVYTPQGEYQRTFAGSGKKAGLTHCPHGLMVDTRGSEPLLVVADRSNRRLQYFNLEGQHMKFVRDELRAPCHFHTRGDLLLIPDLEGRATLFDKENKLIAHLCDGGSTYNPLRTQDRASFVPGKFIAPHGGIFDREGNIIIVEWVEVGRVTKLRKIA